MKTKNFANFGLFANGEFIDADNINEVIEKASKHSESNPNVRYSISWMVFSEGEHIEITEGIKILNFININGNIYISN